MLNGLNYYVLLLLLLRHFKISAINCNINQNTQTFFRVHLSHTQIFSVYLHFVSESRGDGKRHQNHLFKQFLKHESTLSKAFLICMHDM